MKTPIVSSMVWFYRKGGGNPICALVTGNGNGRDGILDLTAWCKNALVPSIHSGVRHRDDPWNVLHPEPMYENGTWAWPSEENNRPRDTRTTGEQQENYGSGPVEIKRKPGRPRKVMEPDFELEPTPVNA